MSKPIEIEPKYNHKTTERNWQKFWFNSDLYHWIESDSSSEVFSIDTPPPTISGNLHMGHVFSYTQADFIARFQRMLGKNVFYPIGFDNNGLPTERYVEKKEGIKAHAIPRPDFVKLCKKVNIEAINEFAAMFKSLGLSFDWRQVYTTIDDSTVKISQQAFIELYNKNLLYRVDHPTFWDYVDRTAIAQAEIEDKEKHGFMYSITFESQYDAPNSSNSPQIHQLKIATTRPELIPACVAVFYNPEDQRYESYKGKKIYATTPIFDAKVPVLPDENVEIDKGTGLVMCCTFGDLQDVEWWRNHSLPLKSCIKLDGTIQNAGKYDGMKVEEARAVIAQDLRAMGLITEEKAVVQYVKCAERSGAPLEIITTQQWFISVMQSKEELINQSESCNWHPEYMKVRLENWINGLKQDWCISRQRYFGVPFPVWYSKRKGEEGKVILPNIDQLPIDPSAELPFGYTAEEVEPETDVMDTWATSALTPQINVGVLHPERENTPRSKLYPFSMRPQAHEIIRTWAFGTIVHSLYNNNSIPWKDVAISGWCLAHDKTKMSKSKGNAVVPQKLIEEYGADVIRYWAAHSKLGVDIAFSDEIFKIGKKLINKLYNVCKFYAIHAKKEDVNSQHSDKDVASGIVFETMDLWILSKLHKAITAATQSFESFDYAESLAITESFFWNDLCDNYLEIIKIRIYNTKEESLDSKNSAIKTLFHVIKSVLRLFAPIIPHVTEELNAYIFSVGENDKSSLHARGEWPSLSENIYYSGLYDKMGQSFLKALSLVRKFKSESGISLNAPIKKLVVIGVDLDQSATYDLANVTNAIDILVKLQCDNEYCDYTALHSDNDLKVLIYYEEV